MGHTSFADNYVWIWMIIANLQLPPRTIEELTYLLTYLQSPMDITASSCRAKTCYISLLGLPGRHVKNLDTLDLFPSSVREPKIEGLDLYTYVYICVRFEVKFSRQVAPKTGQSGSKPDTWQPYSLYITVICKHGL